MGEAKICGRCVLPENGVEVVLDPEGVCGFCREHERRRASGTAAAGAPLLETDFVRTIDQYRGKGEFDCLVMCSGGKDSTAALYYMKRRYKLKALAFTFDHGFETEEAIANVRRAVAALDVPFLLYRDTSMHGLFAKLLQGGSPAVVCHICAIWYMGLTFRMAQRFQVPLIIAGWTKGQMTAQPVMTKCACGAEGPEYQRMGQATRDFLAGLRSDPRYRDFPASMEAAVEKAQKSYKCRVLSPHWFLPQETEEYVALIRRELGWEAPPLSYPGGSTNCLLNFISVHNSMKHFGFTHYHVEMSKLVRENLLGRDEALALLRIDFGPDLLDRIAEPLGVKFRS
jgi:hypothetical protein